MDVAETERNEMEVIGIRVVFASAVLADLKNMNQERK
jgi:hypothetical protein